MGDIMDIPHWPSVICSVLVIALGIGVAKLLGWL